MGEPEVDLNLVMAALKFASEKHTSQRRKGSSDVPYINHPIAVAELLSKVAGVRDAAVIAAALLHDTIEDTDTTEAEIEQHFGQRVLGLVLECTDDKSLPKEMRKQLQVQSAPRKSPEAKLIKLADKANNVSDMAVTPPKNWSLDRRREYLDWTETVVSGLRGQNSALEANYDSALRCARVRLETDLQNGFEHSHC